MRARLSPELPPGGQVPHGHRLDLVELYLSLQDLLDLALLWTLLHLLSTNQVQVFGGQDEVALHRLEQSRKCACWLVGGPT